MKFVILLAIIGFIAVSAAPTKEELIKRASEEEDKLDAEIAKVKSSHPIEARILEAEKRELKLLAGELATAKQPVVVEHLERRLAQLEHRVDETLHRIDGRTGRPSRPTRQPRTEEPTTAASF